MKTTIEIDDELLVEAKKAAAEQRVPLRRLVENGLTDQLAAWRRSSGSGVREQAAPYGDGPVVATLAELPGILGLVPASRVSVSVEGATCRVTPVDEAYVRARRGMLAGRGLLAGLMRARAEERGR
jgi:hypothetical protein